MNTVKCFLQVPSLLDRTVRRAKVAKPKRGLNETITQCEVSICEITHGQHGRNALPLGMDVKPHSSKSVYQFLPSIEIH
jgi:hypothetical protein